MSERVAVRRALISVFDRTGVEDLARAIVEQGGSIVSSGGTGAYLRDAGFEVTDVSDVTGFPEMLDGRVKTLHPKLHGGILADRSKPEHLDAIASHSIEPIDLVVCNLYPFDRKVTPDSPDAEAVPLIDVGGPSMVRAAAKNHGSVGVLVDVADYDAVIEELRAGGLTFETRRRLAGKAFSHLSAYDAAIAEWFAGGELGEKMTIAGERVRTLRYGENPHQPAALYRRSDRGIASAEQLQGKDPSYINYLDLDAAFRLATAFSEPAAAIIKHTNPCGAAIGTDIDEAYRLAFECDSRAAFGGIVGLNRPLTIGIVEQIRSVKLFVECIIAPDYEADALELLAKRKDLRLMRLPAERWGVDALDVHSVSGGFLVQRTDPVTDDRSQMRVATKREPSDEEWVDLLFAWTVAARVKSNSIVLAASETGGRQAIGVGAGQMSRVEAFEIAIRRAGARAKGAVAASDALLPFPDNVEVAAEAGVTAIIQPGGSVRDDEVIAAAEAAGIAMVFTGVRHFWH